ncbi:hypothetical protein Cgig2_019338 [Carnegiea gigantea]|uniref:Rab-GAP TBC domain-containing protein n=1 Tax=Carnegiea gigantea TaxID=171969 RepID=A0A9Q1QND7_9CARY|nr:hypothetical protein Cgig2_019338 [Carnegiea gigantea]
MLNSVPSSGVYGNIVGLFLFSGGGAGGQHGGTAVAVAITAVAGLAFVAAIVYTRSGHLKSPWSRKRRKNALTPQQWRSAFDPDGKLLDGGIKLLKLIRSGNPSKTIQDALVPIKGILISEVFTNQVDLDVQISLALCLAELVRITTKNSSFEDELMKKAFRVIVSSFEALSDSADISYRKRLRILESMTRVNSYVVLLDLECDAFVLDFFRHLLASTKGENSPIMLACIYRLLVKGYRTRASWIPLQQIISSIEEIMHIKEKESKEVQSHHSLLEFGECAEFKCVSTHEGCQKGLCVLYGIDGLFPRTILLTIFLLRDSYDFNSSKEQRDVVRNKKRKEYEKLRKQCRRLLKQVNLNMMKQKESGRTCAPGNSNSSFTEPGSPASEDVVSALESLSSERGSTDCEYSENNASMPLDKTSSCQCVTNSAPSVIDTDSDSESSEGDHFDESSALHEQENVPDLAEEKCNSPLRTRVCRSEDFATWQRIIRLDAVRANAEWVPHSPSQAAVSAERAHRSAEAVGLKDYEHLEPCRIYHAARLIAILEAYAVYDSEIGYCQGMSDLLSPIISVIEEDYMAFWCFIGFMKKARHNFRLDEVGIRRQLNIVSKIIKHKDAQLYRHLVKLQAEDCFFVYRMVVVLFRRELRFEQILCLWEVMWADQAALRAGIAKAAWRKLKQPAPPTEDLLLYAIAASVLQRRKLIIEKYSSMDEILRECNSMAGQLDVWKLLDDAHYLVMRLHDKIDTHF